MAGNRRRNISRLSDMTGFMARAAGLMAGIVIGAGVAGCGSASSNGVGPGSSDQPTGAGQATIRNLCADPAAVTRVQVARIPRVAQLEPSKPGQDRVVKFTVTDPTKARELARAICALPRAPHGVLNCPLDIGGGYQLRFWVMSRHLPLVTIDASGCRAVNGAGRPRLALSPRFWTVFARATGIQAPVPARQSG